MKRIIVEITMVPNDNSSKMNRRICETKFKVKEKKIVV